MYNKYSNPLIERYVSDEMAYIFSPNKKFSTWRKLWTALAESEMELGLNISKEQIEELRANIDNIDFDNAKAHEKRVRHDVMAHVLAYGDVCPNAKGIIHLGATSAFVGDNTDIIVMREALELVRVKLVNLISKLSKFALEYKSLPTLGYTHLQPAQLTTVGKRATLWIIDLLIDYDDVSYIIDNLHMRGVKGTTGTQASYLNLFEGDHEKVKELDQLIADKFSFKKSLKVTGQTYTRKYDARTLSALSSIAQTMHKMTNDLRLLQSLKEVEEPFEKSQIGSSAMAYKRNPMRSERIASLSRYVIAQSLNPQMTASTQWFERTLDDSANKRLAIPESFMAVDSILDIANNVASGLVVYEKVIRKHVESELPFMITENIMMEAVKKGGDRQELHELIRLHSMDAGKMVKVEGKENDLLERIAGDKNFNLTLEDLNAIMDPADYVGRSAEQVVEFINEDVNPLIEQYKDIIGQDVDLRV